MRRIIMCILVTLLGTPGVLCADELNAGFVQGLWYGSTYLVADTPTRIYVALRNNTESDLTGTVRFTDNGTRIGVASVSALPGRIVEAWVDWTPSYGNHTVTATLTDIRIHEIGASPTQGEVEEALAEDTIFIEHDTDNDTLPNDIDTDDDGDGVSDVDERSRGTDPLKQDGAPEKPTEEEKDPLPPKENTESPRAVREETSLRPEGLEHYLHSGTIDTAVAHVSEVLTDAKTGLDTYRRERADALKEYFTDSYDTVETSATTSDGVATITRTSVKRDVPFIESVLGGGKALIASLYTFILWLSSHALAHPALLELLFLLLIIYVLYRTARRLGRRRSGLS